MHEPHLLLERRFMTRTLCSLGVGVILLTLAACGRAPVTAAASKAVATPDPRQEALIERAVRDRLTEENRVTEQQLVNARAAASQRMVGRQMFMKLEDQYRQRRADLPGDDIVAAAPTPMLLAQAQPSATASPQAPAPVETATTPDPKLQHPPVEDQADSMKGKTGEQPKPTPAPSPTAPVAPPNK